MRARGLPTSPPWHVRSRAPTVEDEIGATVGRVRPARGCCSRGPSRVPRVRSARRRARRQVSATALAAPHLRRPGTCQHHGRIRLSTHDVGTVLTSQGRAAALSRRVRRPLPHRPGVSPWIRLGGPGAFRCLHRRFLRIHRLSTGAGAPPIAAHVSVFACIAARSRASAAPADTNALQMSVRCRQARRPTPSCGHRRRDVATHPNNTPDGKEREHRADRWGRSASDLTASRRASSRAHSLFSRRTYRRKRIPHGYRRHRLGHLVRSTRTATGRTRRHDAPGAEAVLVWGSGPDGEEQR